MIEFSLNEILNELIANGKITLGENQNIDCVTKQNPLVFYYSEKKYVCDGEGIWLNDVPGSRQIIFKNGEKSSCKSLEEAAYKFMYCCELVYAKSLQCNCKKQNMDDCVTNMIKSNELS